jgi:hypothetical protein
LAPTSTENQPVFQERVIVPIEMIDINDANHEPKSISRGFRGMGKAKTEANRMVKGFIKDGRNRKYYSRTTERDYQAKRGLLSSVNGS